MFPCRVIRYALLGLAINIAIHAAAYAAGACGREAGPGVFNTFENGYVSLHGYGNTNQDLNGTCSLTITGSDDVNVASSKFYLAGDCDLDPTDINLDKLQLKGFPLWSKVLNFIDEFMPSGFKPFSIDYHTKDVIFVNPPFGNFNQIRAFTDKSKKACWMYGNSPGSDDKCSSLNTLTSLPMSGAILPDPPGSGNEMILNSSFDINMMKFPSFYDDLKVGGGMTMRMSPTEKSSSFLNNLIGELADIFYGASGGKIPIIINKLTLQGCNGNGGLELEPGDYYINELLVEAGCNIKVVPDKNGNKERVNLHVYNFQKLGGACINMEGCADSNSNPPINGQHPEYLAIFVHNGDLLIQNRQHIAAGIYVHNGDIKSESGGLTFIGEMLAQNIGVQNNNNSRFHYQDSKLFNQLYNTASSPREGEFSLAAPAIPRVTKTGDFVYVPVQKDTNGIMGDIKAYALKPDGSTAESPSWTANEKMTINDRRDKLYSTNAEGGLVKFVDLDNDAFAAGSTPSVSQIKAYTINPNDSNGIYLAGRAADSLIGRPYTTQPVILGNLVLFQTDDGFLYAIDKKTGMLKWGYIPRPLVAELKNYATFFRTHPMEGQIAVLPLSETTSEGYIVGSAKGGALHYALKVKGDGTLDSQLWLDTRPGTNPHRPLVLAVGGKNYAWYVAENTKLVRRELAATPAESVKDYKTTTSGKTLTASPALVTRTRDGKAWIRLFIGDESGKVYLAELTKNSGSLDDNPSISYVGHIKVSGAEALDGKVLWLEHARKGEKDYLTAQSSQILTTFISSDGKNYNVDTWASFIGGAKAPTGGKVCPAGQNFSQENDNAPKVYDCVQQLPAPDQGSPFPNVTITGAVNIAFGAVYLPIQYETATECKAQNYLYKLENGNFPTNIYYFGRLLTDNLTLGEHEAFRPQMSILNGKPMMFSGASEMGLYDNGDDTTKVQAAGAPTFSVNLSNYPSGWRELIME